MDDRRGRRLDGRMSDRVSVALLSVPTLEIKTIMLKGPTKTSNCSEVKLYDMARLAIAGWQEVRWILLDIEGRRLSNL